MSSTCAEILDGMWVRNTLSGRVRCLVFTVAGRRISRASCDHLLVSGEFDRHIDGPPLRVRPFDHQALAHEILHSAANLLSRVRAFRFRHRVPFRLSPIASVVRETVHVGGRDDASDRIASFQLSQGMPLPCCASICLISRGCVNSDTCFTEQPLWRKLPSFGRLNTRSMPVTTGFAGPTRLRKER
jgi:hypothetical protein